MIRQGRAWGFGLVLIGVVAVLPSCGSVCTGPTPQCPYYVTLTVAAPDGGALTGVEASVSGSPLMCVSAPPGALCNGGGNGSLHVEAPGFQPVDVTSTVTETPAPACGCPGFTREPSTVTLNPS
jgi:hypothetical protein